MEINTMSYADIVFELANSFGITQSLGWHFIHGVLVSPSGIQYNLKEVSDFAKRFVDQLQIHKQVVFIYLKLKGAM